MDLLNQNNNERIYLIFVSFLALTLAFLSISISLVDKIYVALKIYTKFPLFEFLLNLIFVWLLGLLWLTYQKWRVTDKVRKELEGIVSSINPDVLMVIDPHQKIIQCTTSIKRLLGYEQEEVINQKTDLFYRESQVSPERKADFFQAMEKEGFYIGLAYGKKKNGADVPLEIITAKLKHRPGSVLLLRDITERTWAEKQIMYLSFHDKLTGLYNRAFFEEELKRLDSERLLPLTLIMGDVNGLKLVNDAFGHHEGDKLLIKIANIFKDSFRKEDVIGRVGGDEFIVLLPGTDETTALSSLARIRAACEQESHEPIHLSIALGIATKTHFDQDIKEIEKEAENRMYKSKLLESKSIRASIISSLRRTLFEKSNETEEHTFRLQKTATEIGRFLGMSENELNDLALLATLHDIGKIAIPESIITKTEKLLPEEWEIIKKHPEIGSRIAESSPELIGVAEAVLAHHERWDGTGYPRGLNKENIPLISRIISIVDAYDVIIHGRPYQPPVSQEKALTKIKEGSGSQFDPDLVEMFVALISNNHKEVVAVGKPPCPWACP